MNKFLISLLMIFGVAGAVNISFAEDIKVPVGEQGQSSTAPLPKTGMTKDQVEKQFGEPAEKVDPVGNPPISKWKYADYVVYFEYDHVIHSVRIFHRQDNSSN